MSGAITYTPRLKLAKLPEDYKVWASLVNTNFSMIDGAISGFVIYSNMRGAWTNSTHYAVNDTVIDPSTSIIWRSAVDHYSATIPTTFAQDRANNPTFWTQYVPPAHQRGAWTGPGTQYYINDFVVHGSQYAVCLLDHVSTISFPADVASGYWSVLFDLATQNLPAISGIGDANKVVAVDSSGSSYVLSTMNQFNVNGAADVRLLTTRPTLVTTLYALAPGDGGGGLWRLDLTDTTTPDNTGTVLTPVAGVPPCRYKRIYSGRVSVAWFGITFGSDNSAAINAALACGGAVDLPYSATAYQARELTMNVAGTSFYMNGATIAMLTGLSASNVILLNAVGCALYGGGGIIDCQQGTPSQGVNVRWDSCTVRDITVIGSPYPLRTPNQTLTAWPGYGVFVGVQNGSTGVRLKKIFCDNIRVYYGRLGFSTYGEDDSHYSNIWTFNTQSHGIGIGSLMPPVNCFVSGMHPTAAGYYGFSFANLVDGQLRAVPVSDVRVTGLVARNCAWGGLYADLGQGFGAAKMGADITSSNLQRVEVDANCYHCAVGGIEFKKTLYYTPPAGTSQIEPWYPAYGYINAKVNTWFATNITGYGILPTIGSTTSGNATSHQGDVYETNVWYVGSPPWVANNYYDLWAPIGSFGWNFLCVGDTNARSGSSGTGPGSGGQFVPGLSGPMITTTVVAPANAGSSTITVANATGITNGMIVSLGGATHLPPSATVNGAPVGNVVTLSTPLVQTVEINAPIQFGVGAVIGAARTTLSAQANPGNTSVTLASTTGIQPGCVVFCGSTLPDQTKVDPSYVPGTNPVLLTNAFTGTLANGSAIAFGTEVFDGNLWWRALEQSPSIPYSSTQTAVWASGGDGFTITGTSYNTSSFASVQATGSLDNKTTRCVLRNVRSVGASIGVQMYGTAGGQVDVSFVGCHFESRQISGSFDALQLQGAITINCKIYGGYFNGGISSSQGIRALASQGGTYNIDVYGDAYIFSGTPMYLEDGNTYNVKLRSCTLENHNAGTGLIMIAGTGTLHMSSGVKGVQNNTNRAGWERFAGTVTTVKGMMQRLDLGGSAPAINTPGNLGEWLELDAPTATERGYMVTAVTTPFTNVTWKKLPLA